MHQKLKRKDMANIINIIKRAIEFFSIRDARNLVDQVTNPVIIYRKGEPLPYDESTIEDVEYEEV